MKVVVAVLAVSAVAAGCSDDDAAMTGGADSTTTTRAEGPAFEVRTPDGPSAVIGGPLEGGKGIYLVAAGPGPSLDDVGYSEAEYTASGTATSYQARHAPDRRHLLPHCS